MSASGTHHALFTCVLCMRELSLDERTTEHVFPEALGGLLTLRDLCKPCNDHLGSACDAKLVNHQYVQFSRKRLRLAGKTGKIPNPLENGHIAGDPRRRVRWELEGSIYHHPSVQDANGTVSVTVDERDGARLPEMIAKVEARRGPGVVVTGGTHHHRSGALEFELDLDSTDYKFGIAKIAYELSCLALGRSYLLDPTAGNFRVLLRHAPGPSAAERDVRARFGGLYSGPMLPVPSAHEASLIGITYAHPTGAAMLTYVRILDRFDATLIVSGEPERYDVPKRGRGMRIDVEERTMRATDLDEVGVDWPDFPV